MGFMSDNVLCEFVRPRRRQRCAARRAFPDNGRRSRGNLPDRKDIGSARG